MPCVGGEGSAELPEERAVSESLRDWAQRLRSGVCSPEPGAGTGQVESDLSRPLEGAKPARRGSHLLSPLFGADTAPAPGPSLRPLVIRGARSGAADSPAA